MDENAKMFLALSPTEQVDLVKTLSPEEHAALKKSLAIEPTETMGPDNESYLRKAGRGALHGIEGVAEGGFNFLRDVGAPVRALAGGFHDAISGPNGPATPWQEDDLGDAFGRAGGTLASLPKSAIQGVTGIGLPPVRNLEDAAERATLMGASLLPLKGMRGSPRLNPYLGALETHGGGGVPLSTVGMPETPKMPDTGDMRGPVRVPDAVIDPGASRYSPPVRQLGAPDVPLALPPGTGAIPMAGEVGASAAARAAARDPYLYIRPAGTRVVSEEGPMSYGEGDTLRRAPIESREMTDLEHVPIPAEAAGGGPPVRVRPENPPYKIPASKLASPVSPDSPSFGLEDAASGPHPSLLGADELPGIRFVPDDAAQQAIAEEAAPPELQGAQELPRASAANVSQIGEEGTPVETPEAPALPAGRVSGGLTAGEWTEVEPWEQGGTKLPGGWSHPAGGGTIFVSKAAANKFARQHGLAEIPETPSPNVSPGRETPGSLKTQSPEALEKTLMELFRTEPLTNQPVGEAPPLQQLEAGARQPRPKRGTPLNPDAPRPPRGGSSRRTSPKKS